MIEYGQWLLPPSTTVVGTCLKGFSASLSNNIFPSCWEFFDHFRRWICCLCELASPPNIEKKTCRDAILTTPRIGCGRCRFKEKVKPGGDWNPRREGAPSTDCIFGVSMADTGKWRLVKHPFLCLYIFVVWLPVALAYTQLISQMLTTKVCFLLSAAQVL